MSGTLNLGDRILQFAADPFRLNVTVILDDERVVHLGRQVSVRVYDRAITGKVVAYNVREHHTAMGDSTGKAELDIELDLTPGDPA